MDQAIDTSVLERLLRRDRTVTLIALAAASLLAWIYIISGAGMSMPPMSVPDMGGSAPSMGPSTAPMVKRLPEMAMPAGWAMSYFGLMLAMWSIMMVAMMLPSAAPMILLFATIERRRRGVSPLGATASFATAYLVVWFGFSLLASLLQWLLDRLALLSPAMATANAVLAAAALIAVGIYQFTPLKQACLRGCRFPLEFITRYWGTAPFGIGLRHGLYCLGCCWMLMLLLFVGGIMNLLLVALIAAYVLAEKIVPRGEWLSYGAGTALIGWGGWLLYAHTIA